MESVNSCEHPYITLPYKELGSMSDMCWAINRKISTHNNGAFHFYSSIEQGKICINSPIDDKKVILNDYLRDVIGFKRKKINSQSTRSTSGMVRVIFVETSRLGNSNVPLQGVFVIKNH